MVSVIYRWRIREGAEEEFRAAWRQMTLAIRAAHGSLGSRLHRGVDGSFVGYAQWPSEARRQSAFAGPPASPDAAARMRACIETRYPEEVLQVSDDLLQADGP